MYVKLLATSVWESFPNLILAIVALLGSFVSGIAIVKNYNKTKLEEIKQNGFNLEKMEKMEKFSIQMKTDLEELKGVLNNLSNKQQIDNEYLSKLLDKLEKQFDYYREIMVGQYNNRH